MTSMTRKGFEDTTTMEKNTSTGRSSSPSHFLTSSSAALAKSPSLHQKQPISDLSTSILPLRRRVILSWCMLLMLTVYNLWGSILKTATGNAIWIYNVATSTSPTTTIVGGNNKTNRNRLNEATKNVKSIAVIEEGISHTESPVAEESTMMFNVSVASLKERIRREAAEKSIKSFGDKRVSKKQSMYPPRAETDEEQQTVTSDNGGNEDDTFEMEEEEEDDSNDSGNDVILVEPMTLAAQNAINATIHDNTPFLCIHVGPSKTGTTTIQKNSAGFTSVLAKDNAIYAGKFANTGWTKLFYYFRKCLNKAYKATVETSRNSTSLSTWKASSEECWKKHMQQRTKYDGVEHNKFSKESIILSDEGYSYPRGPLGPRTSGHIQEFFEVQNGYNITVIATYRWYDEWLLSTLKEENKHAQYTVGNKKHKEALWPQLGGRKWEDPWKYVQKHVASDNFNARFYNNIDQTVPRWRKSGFHVKIMDFQSPIDVMEDFYCTQIGQDKVPHTCTYTQSLGNDMPVHHVGSLAATAYDKILVESVDLGLVDLNNITRYQARQDLMDYHTGILGLSFLDLPLICPDEISLNQVLQKALVFDEKVQKLANFSYFDKRQEEHKASFEQLKVSKVFCFVNEQVLLRNATTWEEVLGRLNNTWAETVEVIGGVANDVQ